MNIYLLYQSLLLGQSLLYIFNKIYIFKSTACQFSLIKQGMLRCNLQSYSICEIKSLRVSEGNWKHRETIKRHKDKMFADSRESESNHISRSQRVWSSHSLAHPCGIALRQLGNKQDGFLGVDVDGAVAVGLGHTEGPVEERLLQNNMS